MNTEPVEILGLFAATMTTISFLPQVIKIKKERCAKSISLLTFSAFWIGVLSWLIYGLLIDSLPVTLANAVTLILASAIVIMKLFYDRKASKSAKTSLLEKKT